MSDKRYPTRMHEVLGVEPGELPLQTGEIFTINEDDYGFYHMLDCEGQIIFADQEDAKEYRITADMVTSAINHGITRRPRLSEEQVRVLETLYEVFDFKWLAKQKYGRVMAYANKPHKEEEWYGFWFHGEGDNEEDYGWMVKSSSPVCSLVSWSDPEPLDIVQTLRDAGRLEDK